MHEYRLWAKIERSDRSGSVFLTYMPHICAHVKLVRGPWMDRAAAQRLPFDAQGSRRRGSHALGGVLWKIWNDVESEQPVIQRLRAYTLRRRWWLCDPSLSKSLEIAVLCTYSPLAPSLLWSSEQSVLIRTFRLLRENSDIMHYSRLGLQTLFATSLLRAVRAGASKCFYQLQTILALNDDVSHSQAPM